jgi:hypothetical protein
MFWKRISGEIISENDFKLLPANEQIQTMCFTAKNWYGINANGINRITHKVINWELIPIK